MKDWMFIPCLILAIGLSIAAIAWSIGYGVNSYYHNLQASGYDEVTVAGYSGLVLQKH